MHPFTQICDGSINPDEPDKPRVLLTNPVTEKGSVHSTDQTAKGKPEWIFPRCPANMQYMLGCSMIITEFDEENKPTPTDCSILKRDVWDNGDPCFFVVRIHTTGDIKRSLEQNYIHHECPHGIVVVVPANPMLEALAPNLQQMDEDKKNKMFREPLDLSLVQHLAREEESIAAMMRHHQQANNGGGQGNP